MSKERLSKLQKTILNIYFTEEKAQSEIGYDTLMAATAKALGIMAWIGAGKWQIGSDSFKASFSRSIRNLEKKGLVKLNREFLKEYYKNGELKQYWYYGLSKISEIIIANKGKKLLNVKIDFNNKGVD